AIAACLAASSPSTSWCPVGFLRSTEGVTFHEGPARTELPRTSSLYPSICSRRSRDIAGWFGIVCCSAQRSTPRTSLASVGEGARTHQLPNQKCRFDRPIRQARRAKEDTLIVHEIYARLQGESSFAGPRMTSWSTLTARCEDARIRRWPVSCFFLEH